MSSEAFNISSVCSTGSDMNESLEDFEPTHSLCDDLDDDNIAPKIEMDLTFSQVQDSINRLSMAKDESGAESSIEAGTPPTFDEQLGAEDTVGNHNSKKMKSKKENRTCTVCGDRALGYNFDAITCESCKAFFRRNANKSKYPRCMFQSNCNIDPNTRRFCSACRLAKCFNVGMKKEMILGDDERQKRIQKVHQNRAKKLVQLQKQTGMDEVPRDLLGICPNGNSPQSMDKLCSRVKMEAYCDIPAVSTMEPGLWPNYGNQPQMPAELPMESEDGNRRLLGENVQQLIHVIHSAYSSSFGSTAEEVPMRVETTSLEALMNHIGVLVKLLIRFAKKLVDFTALPQSAQVTLLKGSLLDCITWRSAQMYSLEKGTWVYDDGTEIPTQLLNAAFDDFDSNIQTEHVKLISSIKLTVGDDLALVSLVQCIVLFSPHLAASGTRALTSTAQDKYITLLKHYLESKYDWQTSFDIFSKILNFITATRIYTSKHSKAFLHCDASRLEPLLLEVFDISLFK